MRTKTISERCLRIVTEGAPRSYGRPIIVTHRMCWIFCPQLQCAARRGRRCSLHEMCMACEDTVPDFSGLHTLERTVPIP
jgi:hypothetical protein